MGWIDVDKFDKDFSSTELYSVASVSGNKTVVDNIEVMLLLKWAEDNSTEDGDDEKGEELSLLVSTEDSVEDSVVKEALVEEMREVIAENAGAMVVFEWVEYDLAEVEEIENDGTTEDDDGAIKEDSTEGWAEGSVEDPVVKEALVGAINEVDCDSVSNKVTVVAENTGAMVVVNWFEDDAMEDEATEENSTEDDLIEDDSSEGDVTEDGKDEKDEELSMLASTNDSIEDSIFKEALASEMNKVICDSVSDRAKVVGENTGTTLVFLWAEVDPIEDGEDEKDERLPIFVSAGDSAEGTGKDPEVRVTPVEDMNEVVCDDRVISENSGATVVVNLELGFRDWITEESKSLEYAIAEYSGVDEIKTSTDGEGGDKPKVVDDSDIAADLKPVDKLVVDGNDDSGDSELDRLFKVENGTTVAVVVADLEFKSKDETTEDSKTNELGTSIDGDIEVKVEVSISEMKAADEIIRYVAASDDSIESKEVSLNEEETTIVEASDNGNADSKLEDEEEVESVASDEDDGFSGKLETTEARVVMYLEDENADEAKEGLSDEYTDWLTKLRSANVEEEEVKDVLKEINSLEIDAVSGTEDETTTEDEAKLNLSSEVIGAVT